MENNLLVRRLAEQVKRVYYEERTLWERARDRAAVPPKPHPRWNKRGKDGKNAWERIVTDCCARGIDPVMYVRTTIRYWSRPQVPMPNQLTSDALIARFTAGGYEQLRKEAIESSLKSQMALLRTQLRAWSAMGWAKEALVRFVLMNHSGQASAISPLLRYCAARRDGLKDIADLYEEEAMMQYARDKSFYKEIWKSLLPEDIDEIADHYQRPEDLVDKDEDEWQSTDQCVE